MNKLYFDLAYFLFIIPVLTLIGFFILIGKQPKSPVFYWFLIIVFLLIIFTHLNNIYNIVRFMATNRPIEKEFGVFILLFALFLLIVHLHHYFFDKKNRNK